MTQKVFQRLGNHFFRMQFAIIAYRYLSLSNLFFMSLGHILYTLL